MEMNGTSLRVGLVFARQYGGFVVTTFIPIVLLILIAFLTFFFERDDFTNRVMVTLSVFIVLASLFSHVSGNLPNTSYIKCIDIFFLCSMFLISLVFACHVSLSLLQRHAQRVKKIHLEQLFHCSRPSTSQEENSNENGTKKHLFRFALVSGNKIALVTCCCALLACLPILAMNCFWEDEK